MTLQLTDKKDVAALLREASTKPNITGLSFKNVRFDQNESAALVTLMKVNRKWNHVLFENCGSSNDEFNNNKNNNDNNFTDNNNNNNNNNNSSMRGSFFRSGSISSNMIGSNNNNNNTTTTNRRGSFITTAASAAAVAAVAEQYNIDNTSGGQLDLPIATFMFNDNVKRLSFVKTFSQSTSIAVNAALHFTQCLESVRIIETKLHKENAQALSEAIGDKHCKLKELDFQSTKMDDDAVQLLAKGLSTNKNLKILSIENCRLRDENVKLLLQGLAKNGSIAELKLGYNQCSSSSFVWLAYILESESCNLTRLSMENQTTTAVTEKEKEPLNIKSLAAALQSNKGLKYLDLSGNHLDNEEMIQIIMALKSNTTLETLHLWDNKLTDSGAKILADVIPSIQGLKRLYLGDNHFGKEGTKHVLQGLELNDAIQFVALPHFSWVREMPV